MRFAARLSVQFFATVTLSAADRVWIFAHVIPVDRCRRAVSVVSRRLVDRVTVRLRCLDRLDDRRCCRIVSRRAGRPLWWLVVDVVLRHERYISVNDVVLPISRIVVGLRQLRGRTTTSAFVLSLGRRRPKFANEFSEGFADLVLRLAWTYGTKNSVTLSQAVGP